MSLLALLIIAAGGAWGVGYLIHYIPLYAEFGKKQYSPRLIVCKFLAPADAMLTLLLICGSWVGLTTAVLGISMIVYNVLTGVGISCGVIIIRKWYIPRWQKQFRDMSKERLETNAT